jgi:acetyltransferase-like isoleucine patch superfamily enzyme
VLLALGALGNGTAQSEVEAGLRDSLKKIASMPAAKSVLNKLGGFWQQPFFDKLNRISNFYYKQKGAFLYRWIFKRFGKGSYIRKPLLIANPKFVSIGEYVSIRDGVRLEAIQDSKARDPNLSIGNNTNIEQNVHIICHSRIQIGTNVSITGNCSIVDVTHPYSDVHNPMKIGARIQDDDSYVEIGDGSFIGYGTVILPNVRIGAYVIVGANSVVLQDIPDYAVAAGAPARIIKRFEPGSGSWIKVRPEVVGKINE